MDREHPGSDAAVLVIDPDPTCAEDLRAPLVESGLAGRVDRVSALAEGLDGLAARAYVLVVVAMREAADLASIDRVRAIDPEVPIVLTTGTDDRELARAALQKGAQDCALKEDFTGRGAVRILSHAIERQRIMLELQEARQREQYLATHDPLTGIPNRTLFYDRLTQALAAAARYKTMLAVLFLDLDGFKRINDEQGHEAGDEVLRETARRASGIIRKSDTVARIGGDEFTIIVGQIGKRDDAERVARNLLERIGKPIALPAGPQPIRASIGIAIHPGDGDRADTLVRNADAAMYAAKEQGGHRYAFYTRRMHHAD